MARTPAEVIPASTGDDRTRSLPGRVVPLRQGSLLAPSRQLPELIIGIALQQAHEDVAVAGVPRPARLAGVAAPARRRLAAQGRQIGELVSALPGEPRVGEAEARLGMPDGVPNAVGAGTGRQPAAGHGAADVDGVRDLVVDMNDAGRVRRLHALAWDSSLRVRRDLWVPFPPSTHVV